MYNLLNLNGINSIVLTFHSGPYRLIHLSIVRCQNR